MSERVPWEDRWYHDVPKLIDVALAHYIDIGKKWERVTAKQIKSFRKWGDWVDPEKLVAAILDLQYLYIPIKQEPGPIVLFPEFDLAGVPTRCQSNPRYELLGNAKYVTLGVKQDNFFGPVWLGNQDSTLDKIVRLKYVVVCEGPYDLLALRLAAPEVPSLSSLTKKISKDHLDYLRLLGVERVYLMYDNEKSERGGDAMKAIQEEFKDIRDIRIDTLACPVGDPSECLETKAQFRALRNVLTNL